MTDDTRNLVIKGIRVGNISKDKSDKTVYSGEIVLEFTLREAMPSNKLIFSCEYSHRFANSSDVLTEVERAHSALQGIAHKIGEVQLSGLRDPIPSLPA